MTTKEVFIKYIEELGWADKIHGGDIVYYDNGNINIALDSEKLKIRIYNYKYFCSNNATQRCVDTCDTIIMYYGDPGIFNVLDNLQPLYDHIDKANPCARLKYRLD